MHHIHLTIGDNQACTYIFMQWPLGPLNFQLESLGLVSCGSATFSLLAQWARKSMGMKHMIVYIKYINMNTLRVYTFRVYTMQASEMHQRHPKALNIPSTYTLPSMFHASCYRYDIFLTPLPAPKYEHESLGGPIRKFWIVLNADIVAVFMEKDSNRLLLSLLQW